MAVQSLSNDTADSQKMENVLRTPEMKTLKKWYEWPSGQKKNYRMRIECDQVIF